MKLFVHIGLPKTATTFLQAIAHSERERLKEAEVYYPEEISNADLINHLTFSKLVENSDDDGILRLLSDYADKARACKCHTIFLSHEELVTLSSPLKSTQSVQKACIQLDLSISVIVTTRPWRDLFISSLKQELATLGSASFSDRAGSNGAPTLAELFIKNISEWERICTEITYLRQELTGNAQVERSFFRTLNWEVPENLTIQPQNSRRNMLFTSQTLGGVLRNAYSSVYGIEAYDLEAEMLADKCSFAIEAEIRQNAKILPAIINFENHLTELVKELSDAAKTETIRRIGPEGFEAIFHE